MIERKLIHIETIDDNKAVVKEKGKGYVKSNLFAVCNFELNLIPLKLNLPMVCKPSDWRHESEMNFVFNDYKMKDTFMLSNLRGGYLSDPTIEIYNRFSLITSHNLSNFNIELHESKYKELCIILNGLQNQGFQINKDVLEFIKKNRTTFEKEGLMMPRILAHVNLKEANDHLRISYFLNKPIKSTCSLSDLLKELAKQMQAARYDDLIIRLASAYEDFVFYLPAFMDFRGRIYRSGILHFHERDLSKSLLIFSNNPQEGSNMFTKDIVSSSAAFKYKKFYHYDDALQWYKEKKSLIYTSDESLISFAKDASDPFQFIAKVLCRDEEYNRQLITQDAAASAYQIMSYLLLNEDMARKTNLIPHSDGKIQDVYMSILNEFKEYLHIKINDIFPRPPSSGGACVGGVPPEPEIGLEALALPTSRLLMASSRSFFRQRAEKTIGQKRTGEAERWRGDWSTLRGAWVSEIILPSEGEVRRDRGYESMIGEVSLSPMVVEKYENLLSPKDSYNLAKLSNDFWKYKYPDIANLMKLISLLCWFSSVMDRAVIYGISYFKTIQDYMSFEKEVIIVYERDSKKRRRVTLSVPTTKRDKRKTQSSACANFIHQKDAYIALKVVESLLREGAPIYTVHDNFITTASYARIVPDIYTNVFIQMGHPINFINDLININIIIPYKHNYLKDHLNTTSLINDEPINDQYLTDIFNNLLPTTYKSKVKRKMWDNKVSEFVKCYNTYVESVWNKDSSILNENNWYKFQKLLENKSHNYSVHY
ncbi:PREDICTED: uncharacterized protein LOC109342314 [Lupinus angustifolius]|uniref:uncharacterized protein LOC109342314 n=1 Tax=Lupinus angustifolius TaxID=3871 RepID=UPI00092F964B|nr:PREDICTED: uncharacterized protein LOC109342314 [Lupinus angustifolius]